MIKFSKEKVKLLHQLMAEATGGSVGVRDEGLTFSFMGFGVKLATAITGSVTVLLLAKVGYVPNAEQTESAKMGINALVNLFPAAVMLLSIIPLFFYRLDGKMDDIAKALDERNGEK